MGLPWRFTLDDGNHALLLRYTFVVEDNSFTLYAESFKGGVSVLGRPSWVMDGTFNGRRGRVVDFNWGMHDEKEAREVAAWAVSQIRSRSGEEFFQRRQVALPGVAS
jgi:hypothetical protein